MIKLRKNISAGFNIDRNTKSGPTFHPESFKAKAQTVGLTFINSALRAALNNRGWELCDSKI